MNTNKLSAQWVDNSNLLSTVSAIECDLIQPPAYTTRNSEDHYVGDRVIYRCTNNTWFDVDVDVLTFECKGDGYWEPALRPCTCKLHIACSEAILYVCQASYLG